MTVIFFKVYFSCWKESTARNLGIGMSFGTVLSGIAYLHCAITILGTIFFSFVAFRIWVLSFKQITTFGRIWLIKQQANNKFCEYNVTFPVRINSDVAAWVTLQVTLLRQWHSLFTSHKWLLIIQELGQLLLFHIHTKTSMKLPKFLVVDLFWSC